ncbi:hypothetical protein ANN_17755 [Periplaneta americana]|uniref:Reverse transcriptase domain-containing protein n=1 Tax=Periplaneta americana TaxID=6978 RepID=A0ABQ8SW03_PERAM|nr:hypothetical protein ANN_17755 [Periplaneta americana]
MTLFFARTSQCQQVLESVVARKHLSVDTTIYVTNTSAKKQERVKIRRELDLAAIEKTDTKEISDTIQKCNIEEAVKIMERCIQGATLKSNRQNKRAQPWFNQECYKARKHTMIALKKALSTQTVEHLQRYNVSRREYKNVIKRTKENFQEEEERKRIEEAEQQWYKAVSPRQPRFPKDIPMTVWENHFRNVLHNRETRPKLEHINKDVVSFTVAEVEQAMHAAKMKKACGPDKIFNEHLKITATYFKEIWTAIYNKCLEEGKVPENWRCATLKVLYKGKGNIGDPNSYKGIALECAPFKILTSLITKRLYKLTEDAIPEAQFGFTKGKSTLQAVKCLQEHIEEALNKQKGKLHAVFIDYTKAFDLVNRTMLIDKLENITRKNYITRLLRNIMESNYVQIDDNLDRSQPLEQPNGVLQGDPLSPLLFNIATSDVYKDIEADNVKIYAYAVDMVILSTDIENLQTAFNHLKEWANKNELLLNENKSHNDVQERR